MNVSEMFSYLNSKGVQTRPVWRLNHLQKPYKKCQSFFIEKAIDLVNSSLCLPSSINIKDEEIEKVVGLING